MTGSGPPYAAPAARPAVLRTSSHGLRRRLLTAFLLVGVISGVAAVFLGYAVAVVVRQREDYGFPVVLEPAVWLIDLLNAQSRDTMLLICVVTVVGTPVLVVILALLAADRVLRPVGQLAQAARHLAAGHLDTRLPVRGADELAELVRAFNQMAASLEDNVGQLRAMEANARRFAGDVSHELRTPLAAMTAVSGVLDRAEAELTGDASRAARLVSAEIGNLTRLTEDLIEVSRFDAGTATLVLDDIDLLAAVSGTLRTRGWAGQVSTVIPPNLVVRADPRRLDVILANLIGNGLRHGGPPVTVTADSHQVDGHRWLAVYVTDRGPGLPATVLPHVFERFYKSDSSRGRSTGSGLGLTIAWENVRLHGGTLQAGNNPDGGACFTLRLPYDASYGRPTVG